MVIVICVLFRHFELMVSALPINLEMGLCRTLGSDPSSMTALFATTHRTLFAPQRSLRGAIEARVLNRIPLRVSKKDL
jgi:hypothetical protein